MPDFRYTEFGYKTVNDLVELLPGEAFPLPASPVSPFEYTFSGHLEEAGLKGDGVNLPQFNGHF